jgi:hypothetical protein
MRWPFSSKSNPEEFEIPKDWSRDWNLQEYREPNTSEEYLLSLQDIPLMLETVRIKALRLIECFALFYDDKQLSDFEAYKIQAYLTSAVMIFVEMLKEADVTLVPNAYLADLTDEIDPNWDTDAEDDDN